MCAASYKLYKRKFKLPKNQKLKRDDSFKRQITRKNIELWINSLPDPKMAEFNQPENFNDFEQNLQQGNSNENCFSPNGSPQRSSISSEIEYTNVIPQRLRSAVKKTDNIDIGDTEISFPSLSQSANKETGIRGGAVRSLTQHFESPKHIESSGQSPVNHLTSVKTPTQTTPIQSAFTPNIENAIQRLRQYAFLARGEVPQAAPSQNQQPHTADYNIKQNSNSSKTNAGPLSYKADINKMNPAQNPETAGTHNLDTQTGLTKEVEIQTNPQYNFERIEIPEEMNQQQMHNFLKTLTDRFNEMQLKITDTDLIASSVSDINRRMEIHRKKMLLNGQQLKEALSDHEKLNIMADIIVRQDQKIHELNERVIDLQARSMKNNIVLGGITEKKGEQCETTAQNFFKQNLGIDDIEIDVAHRMGTGTNRPIVVRLKQQQAKNKFFGNITKLKGLKNQKGRYYQVDNQLPEELSEKRKHMRYHFQDFSRRNTAQSIEQSVAELTMKKGTLLINDQPYKKQCCPTETNRHVIRPSETN